MNGSASKVVTNILNGPCSSHSGAGTWEIIVSTSGEMSFLSWLKSCTAHPSRPLANKVGKSNCSSVAPKLANKSNTSLWTSTGRASERSILLITTIGRNPNFNALPTTNFVCGKGPSAESTNTITPSTIDKMRSTSPPKSACPGVSTILMRVPFQSIDVHLAKIVMPRSRSKSPESIAHVSTAWLSRKVPLCFKKASTKVVLPWSTCAIMAILRMFCCILYPYCFDFRRIILDFHKKVQQKEYRANQNN